MDKKKKIILIGSIILIIASLVISVLLITNKPEPEEFKIDGIDLPTNKSVLEDKIIDDIQITNVSLLTREGISTYKAKVVNNGSSEISKTLNIIFYINEEKIEIPKEISLTPGSSMYINIESEINLTEISKIEYVLE